MRDSFSVMSLVTVIYWYVSEGGASSTYIVKLGLLILLQVISAI